MALTFITAVIILSMELRRGKAKAIRAVKTVQVPEKEVGLVALITPPLPLLLITIFKWPIIPALLVGILYGLAVTQRSWRSFINLLT